MGMAHSGEGRNMIRWEYRQYLFEHGDKLLENLNSLGAHGWEAFHFEDVLQGGSKKLIFFKRPKAQQTPKEGT